MNIVTATGWLMKDAWSATPPGPLRLRIVLFDLYLTSEHTPEGQPCPWRCEIENDFLIRKHEAKLVAGAGVIVRGELAGKPFEKHGLQQGWTRFLRIEQLEFSRLPVCALHAAELAPAPAGPAAS